jgi:hypothetical protein
VSEEKNAPDDLLSPSFATLPFPAMLALRLNSSSVDNEKIAAHER